MSNILSFISSLEIDSLCDANNGQKSMQWSTILAGNSTSTRPPARHMRHGVIGEEAPVQLESRRALCSTACPRQACAILGQRALCRAVWPHRAYVALSPQPTGYQRSRSATPARQALCGTAHPRRACATLGWQALCCAVVCRFACLRPRFPAVEARRRCLVLWFPLLLPGFDQPSPSIWFAGAHCVRGRGQGEFSQERGIVCYFFCDALVSTIIVYFSDQLFLCNWWSFIPFYFQLQTIEWRQW